MNPFPCEFCDFEGKTSAGVKSHTRAKYAAPNNEKENEHKGNQNVMSFSSVNKF